MPGHKVSAEEWNALFNLSRVQGNNNAEGIQLLMDTVGDAIELPSILADYDKKIEAVEEKVKTFEEKLSEDYITDLVSKTYVTKVDLEGLTKDIGLYTEQVNTVLKKVTDEAIINTVSSEFYKKTEIDDKVFEQNELLKSTVQQSSESILSTVEETYVTKDASERRFTKVEQTIDGLTITDENGTTKIDGSSIDVESLFAEDILVSGNFIIGKDGALIYNKEDNILYISASSVYMGSGATLDKAYQETLEEITGTKNATLIEAYDEYATGVDNITEPNEEEWSENKPNVGNGIYVWQRRVNVYGNGDVVYGPPVCITGSKGADGEAATNVRIYSSRGTVFKNNTVSTVLSVVVFKGGLRITDSTALKKEYGSTAYLQWSWVRGDNTGIILSTDSRLSNNGFSFTLSPDDVDSNITFQCDLIIG